MGREITLHDLLVMALKRAKLILVCTLIAGVIFGGYGVYRGYAGMAENAVTEAQRRQDVESAELAVVRAQNQVDELQEYTENSLYCAINPYNKAVCTLLFHVDTGHEASPEDGDQARDKTGQVIAAYTELYKSDETVQAGIYRILGGEVDMKYVHELIGITSEGSNMVRISVVGEDVNAVSDIAHLLYESMNARIRETVAPHSTQMLVDYAGYEIDADMRARQDASVSSLANARTTLTENQTALDTLLGNPVDENVGTVLLEQGVKYGVLGLLAGFVIGCCITLLGNILGRRLDNAGMAAARYKFPLLGTLPQENKGRWFNGWIRSLENEPNVGYAEAAQLVAASLAAVTKGKPVLLVSTGEPAMLEKLAAGLGEHVRIGGDILCDAKAVQALDEAENVVLVEERGKARLEQVDSEVLRLETLDKKIVGMVLC